MTDRTAPPPEAADKATLRASMRVVRRSLADCDERSEVLWRHLIALPAMAAAETVMAFTTLPGEPDTRSLLAWCAATGRLAAAPEADVDPTWPDVVIVPGLAFTARGDRLGQGGGWYDRFLSEVRPDCVSIGVCFVEQLADVLPVEPHDVTMDYVVTDRGVVR
jgi:5-formyltetrahydrofolate cyclo-ligase